MHPEFTPTTETPGLDVVDPIETRRFTLRTDSAIDPTEVNTDGFALPVKSACHVHTTGFESQYAVPVDVRSADGTHIDVVNPTQRREFEADEYLLDVHGPLKIYVWVESAVTIDATTDTVRIDFGTETPVRIGARSYHRSPAETITVPDDPEALMQAVSTFPSALKTTSPERSWPTLRGHPPRIERGETLDIPDSLDVPETGVTIEVPPEYGAIYTVAPLAFYLGAEVVPAETARLTAESGVVEPLEDDSTALAESVADVFERVFTLDCITRTEGHYPVDLDERTVLESKTDLDFAALYDAPIDERLRTYLGVPDEAVEAVAPTWHRETHVRPAPEVAEMLPAIVDDLSLVSVERSERTEWTEAQKKAKEGVESFFRRATPDEAVVRSPSDDDETDRSIGDDATVENGNADGTDSEREIPGIPDLDECVPVPDSDAFEQAWAGDGTTLHATKLLPDALGRETPAPTDGVVDITVVCNDDQMREESETVTTIYDERDDLHVEVEAEYDVETGELRELLRADCDLFHFIGHIDGRGFECPDGLLDAESIAETGATAILLNGCRSYDQGRALVSAGANAAIVSLWDVGNRGAVEVGETFARLLDHGFGVGTAATIVDDYAAIGRDYLVLGDPSVTISASENGTPLMYHLDESAGGADEVGVELRASPTRTRGVGTVVQSHFSDSDEYHIAVGTCERMRIGRDALRQRLLRDPEPLVVGNELVWSDNWFDSD